MEGLIGMEPETVSVDNVSKGRIGAGGLTEYELYFGKLIRQRRELMGEERKRRSTSGRKDSVVKDRNDLIKVS